MDNEQLTAKELQNRIIYAQAILKITDKLDEAKVPYTLHECWGGYQLRFPWAAGDVVAHAGSYGSHSGKVESMGFSWDVDDVTVMEPEAMAIMVVAEYIIHEVMKR